MNRRNFLSATIAGGLALNSSLAKAENKSKISESSWEGKSIIVTGGSAGLGKALVLEGCRRGAHVGFCARNEKKGLAIEEQARKLGGKASFFKADVRSESEIKNFISKFVNTAGRLDVAVNNAAIEYDSAHFETDSLEKHLDVIQTNLVGTMTCMRYEIPEMLKLKKGFIVNIASTAAIRGTAHEPSYSASKHGILGLTRSLAKRYAKENIIINCISPYLLDHEMGSDKDQVDPRSEYFKESVAKIPTGRLISIDEVVRNVFWLSDENAVNVTGQNIIIDGGAFS